MGITLAWAVEVDPAQLGACLETYFQTKVALTILRLGFPRSHSSWISKVPGELRELFTAAYWDVFYAEKIQQWRSTTHCVEGTCWPWNHLTRKTLLANHGECPYFTDDMPANSIYCVYSSDLMGAHDQTLDSHHGQIGWEGFQFGRLERAFAREFDVHLTVTLLWSHVNSDLPRYTEYGGVTTKADIKAYLSIPIQQVPVRHASGLHVGFYAVRDPIDDAAVRRGLSIATDDRFEAAVSALKLEDPHTQITVEDHGPDEGGYRMLTWEVDAGEFLRLEMQRRVGITYKTLCNECGGEACRGRYRRQRARLMLLGDGEIEAECDKDIEGW